MFLIFFSSILLALSFFSYKCSLFVFIGFVPLFFALQSRSRIKSFFISYLAGFLFYLGGLYWLYHVTAIGLIIISLYLAVYFGIFGLFFNYLARTPYPVSRCPCLAGRQVLPVTLNVVSIPLIWILLEYIQSRLFTGFGWLLLGYSQYKNLHFIQIADLLGVCGVSFVIMAVNFAIYQLFKRSLKETIIIILVVFSIVSYGRIRLNQEFKKKDIAISVIQGNIPQELKWDPKATESIFEKYSTLTKIAALDNTDLVVWPETSLPGFFRKNKDITDKVLGLAKKSNTPILIGANTIKGNYENFNSAILISENGKVIGEYDKVHLVPFGEYVPFSKKIPALHDLVLGALGEFTPGLKYEIFTLGVSPVTRTLSPVPRSIKFAVLICFEDIFSGLARRFVKDGAEFLIVITNDGWYGNTPASFQHAACSVFRAIENRVSVVRCANTGYSCFIDPHGRIYSDVRDKNTPLFITGHKTSIVKY
ncbi:MAG: apolipoprotein N-acyltransferase [Candidatus Omnitrophota bacterium]